MSLPHSSPLRHSPASDVPSQPGLRFLHRPGREAVPDLEAQLAFLARWPETPSDPPPPLPADAPQMVEESPNRPT